MSGGVVLSTPTRAVSTACRSFCFGFPPDSTLATALSAFRAASQNPVTPGVCAAAGSATTSAPTAASATNRASLRIGTSSLPCLILPNREKTLRGEPVRRQPAQNLIVRLAGRVALEGADEDEAPRLLVAGELATTPRRQLGLVEGVALGDLHERDDDLAEAVVGHADGDAVEHAGVLAQDQLDLLGVHLLAPGVDARGTAPEKPDRPVRVDLRVVAGDGVAAAVDHLERVARLVGVAPVAERDAPADGEEPDLVASGRDLRVRVLPEHLDAVVDGEARRLDLGVAGGRGLAARHALGRAQRGQQGHLREVSQQPRLGLGAPRDARARDRPQ